MSDRPLGLYIHWPYCISKCPYCDFNSFVGQATDAQKLRTAYLKELENSYRETPHHQLKTIFFGGGTPSLMPPELARDLIEAAKSLWSVRDDIEITLEANPATVDQDRFVAFRDAGVNRLSLGIQSLDDQVLTFLGRKHSAQEAIHALEMAREIFPRFSFDLIYAYVGQTLSFWEDTLRRGLAFAKGHISLYQLTIEPGTAFYGRAARGEKLTVDDDLGAELYELTGRILKEADFYNYEISNYAQKGQESQHNLIYWRYQDYVGIGPGAHGRYKNTLDEKIATQCLRGPESWADRVLEQGCGYQSTESLSPETQALEMIMMGLRLEEGIEFKRFSSEIGHPIENFINASQLQLLEKEGYLRKSPTTLSLTPQGRNNLNSILKMLVE